MIDDFCQDIISQKSAYCDRIKMRVPASFCTLICQGKPELWCRESIKKARIERMANISLKNAYRKKELVTVFIPVVEADSKYLRKTIESATKNAGGPIEIIVMSDGWKAQALDGELVLAYPDRIGLRKGMNIAANKANGKYFVKLDSHCALTTNWDLKLKDSCDANTFVAPAIDKLDEKTWQGTGSDMSFVTLDDKLEMQYYRPFILAENWPLETETITTIACCFMVETDYYRSLGGCDEGLAEWGNLGAEWALRVWLTGGRVLLRSDVVCSHLFRKTLTPFTVSATQWTNAAKKLYRQWILGKAGQRVRTSGWLVEKFAYISNCDVPFLGLGGKGYTIKNKDWDFLRAFIEKNNIKKVLEIGAGKSTLMFDNLGCEVVSYETMPFIANVVNNLSTNRVCVKEWNGKEFETDKNFDLVFIDGPAGGNNREVSYKSASNIKTRFIACHDAKRKWETAWINKYLTGYRQVAVMPDGVIQIRENATIRI